MLTIFHISGVQLEYSQTCVPNDSDEIGEYFYEQYSTYYQTYGDYGEVNRSNDYGEVYRSNDYGEVYRNNEINAVESMALEDTSQFLPELPSLEPPARPEESPFDSISVQTVPSESNKKFKIKKVWKVRRTFRKKDKSKIELL